MKKYVYTVLITIAAIIIQQSIISRFKIFGVGFDIVYVMVICTSLFKKEVESFIFALICGIIRDCYFPFLFGLNSIIYIITAYLLSQIQKRIFRDSLIIPVFFTFTFTIIKTLFYYAYFYIASIKFDFKSHIYYVLILEPLLNSLVSIVIYKFIKKIYVKDMIHD